MHQADDHRFIDAPKAVLHDHLDGGLRPRDDRGDRRRRSATPCRPTTPEALDRWFVDAAGSGSLVRYLATFEHTVAVMQRACGPAAGGGGVRGRPGRRRRRLRRGALRPRAAPRGGARAGRGGGGGPGRVRQRRRRGCARTAARSSYGRSSPRSGTRRCRARSPSSRYGIATAACAGSTSPAPRPGYPPTRHLDAFEYLQRQNAHFTIHAGEAFGLPSIWQALQWCGAERLGHGVRIVDDIDLGGRRAGPRSAGRATSATAGSRSRCARRPTCRPAPRPRWRSIPIGVLTDLRFRVTVNTDNRLMSGTTMSREMELVARGLRLRPRRRPLVHDQRDEERVPAVRRAARPHRAGGQAGL